MLKPGDIVRLLDEPGQGTVTKVQGDQIAVEIDGIELTFSANQLVKVEFDDLVDHPTTDKDAQAAEKLQRIVARNKLGQLQPKQEAVYELDLHIHELLDRFENMSNAQILQYQMECCRRFVKEAMDKRYPKVVLIHGVGQGVLRTEIHRWLDSQSNVDYHDASYRKYGYGATEVFIRGHK